MNPLIVAIAGGTGSGKSTVAHELAEAIPNSSVSFLEMDSYYRDLTRLSSEERESFNWDHPDAFDLQLLGDHLARLSNGSSVESPLYDFATHSRLASIRVVKPADVVVVDGILLLANETIRSFFDISVFLETDSDIRLIRRIRRDMAVRGRSLDSVLNQYLATVRPMHLQFVEPSKRFADIVIADHENRGFALEPLINKIRIHLRSETSARRSGSADTTMLPH